MAYLLMSDKPIGDWASFLSESIQVMEKHKDVTDGLVQTNMRRYLRELEEEDAEKQE